MNNGGNWTHGDPITTDEPYGFHSFISDKRISDIDGYIPVNNKLFTYPYKFLQVSNNTGLSATYRYEDFEADEMEFLVTAAIMPNPTVMIAPSDYKGVTLSYEHALPLSGYPLCSWNTDTYAAWLAQNGASTGIALIGSTAAVIGGLLTANPLAIGGGALSVAHQLAQIHQAAIQPDQAKGQVGEGQSLLQQICLIIILHI
jgi:hypothetical protein